MADASVHASAQDYAIAYGILNAALGEVEAWAQWNRWTADERNEVALFAGEHFGPQLRKLCDELVAWKDRHAE